MSILLFILVLMFLAVLVWSFVDPAIPEKSVEVKLNPEETVRKELARFAQEWADKHPPITLDELEARRKEWKEWKERKNDKN